MPLTESEIDALINNLLDPDLQVRTDAVLLVEIVKLPLSRRAEVKNLLYHYINEFRTTDVDKVRTAVGSAIRKYAAYIDESELSIYAKLFDHTEYKSNPSDIDLELCKAYGWENTPFNGPVPKELVAALVDVLMSYIPRRIALQRNHASVICMAMPLLSLLDPETAMPFTDMIQVKWIREIIYERLLKMVNKRSELGYDVDGLKKIRDKMR
jgi:hypothetical protein